jgi:hypothetical protein
VAEDHRRLALGCLIFPFAYVAVGLITFLPFVFGSRLGLFVIPLWIVWLGGLNRIYDGWQKIKIVQAEVSEEQQWTLSPRMLSA